MPGLDQERGSRLSCVVDVTERLRIVNMPPQKRVAEQLGTAVLQGRPLGRKHYPRLCELLADVPPGDVALMDFAGVEIVTGSWINEALVPLLRWAADERND